MKVAAYAFGLLVASTGNSIMFKKMENKMQNYPLFLNQLSTVVYIPIFFVRRSAAHSNACGG